MSHASSLPFLETLDDVRNALLDRIPVNERNSFFTDFHPQEITSNDVDINTAQLERACELIRHAITHQQKVLLYGDYDCDGITSTAVLWQSLRSLGLITQPFIPRRDVYGYGMSLQALKDLWIDQSFDLIITVDNGIVAHEAVEWAQSKGAKVIITDHHHVGEKLPTAEAIVHSSLLCGVGVVWMVVRELDLKIANSHLDLVAIGTLADQVPLIGANRVLVKRGLSCLRETTKPSLQELAKISGVKLATLTTSDVTFRLAPRINAMGRLADPMDALRALVAQSTIRLTSLLTQMEVTNRERQKLTEKYFSEISTQIGFYSQGSSASVHIVAGDYHEGVIGLLASKLVEKSHLPAIVISKMKKVWKASCRSIPEVNMIETLQSVSDVNFASLGGHSLAAGFSLNPETAESDLIKISNTFRKKHVCINAKKERKIVGNLSFKLLNLELLQLLSEFEPFGSGNEEPCFILSPILLQDTQYVGQNKQHWKGSLYHEMCEKKVPAIFFGAREKYPDDLAKITQVVVRIVPSTYGSRGFDIHIAEAHGDRH